MSDILQDQSPNCFWNLKYMLASGCARLCVCVATLTEHDVQYLNSMKTAVAFPWKVKHWACGLSNTALCL